MTKEQIRATVLTVTAQIVPDEDPSNPWDDIPIRQQMEPDPVEFLPVIVAPRKCHGVEVPGNDYVLAPLSDRSVAFSGAKDARTLD